MRGSIQELGAVSGYRSHIEHKVEEAVVSTCIYFYNIIFLPNFAI